AMEFKQRVMIETQSPRQTLARDRLVKHATESRTIHASGLHAKTDNPPRIDIHHDQNPVCLEQNRFGSKQVYAPQRVLRVPKQGEPRRSTVLRTWSIVPGQHAPDHILVQLDCEALGQLLGDLGTTQMRVAPFELNEGLDQLSCGSFGTRFTLPA